MQGKHTFERDPFTGAITVSAADFLITDKDGAAALVNPNTPVDALPPAVAGAMLDELYPIAHKLAEVAGIDLKLVEDYRTDEAKAAELPPLTDSAPEGAEKPQEGTDAEAGTNAPVEGADNGDSAVVDETAAPAEDDAAKTAEAVTEPPAGDPKDEAAAEAAEKADLIAKLTEAGIYHDGRWGLKKLRAALAEGKTE